MDEQDLDFGDFDNATSVKMRPWMAEKEFVLGTVENVEQIADACIASGRYALDLETSGLDNRVFDVGGAKRTADQIAGVGLSPDGKTGYYIPLRHVKVGLDGMRTPLACNVPLTVFDKAFRRLMDATTAGKTVAVFHNGKFDQEFLEHNGGEPWGDWDKPTAWDDTMILAYLRDSRLKTKGLKALSAEHLGMEMIELDELFPEAKKKTHRDFTTLDPRKQHVLWYACGDVICTRLLYDWVAPQVLAPADGQLAQPGIYKIEKMCVAATRWMERNRIHIDREKVAELIRVGHKEWLASVMLVYAEVEKHLGRDVMPGSYKVIKDTFVADDPSDIIHAQLVRAEKAAEQQFPDPVGKIKVNGKEYPLIYDVNSPKQLGPLLEELGVEGLKTTAKSGQISTSKADLDRIIEEEGDNYPFMGKIKRFREVQKALSTFLYPMWLDSDPRDDTMRISFQAHKVDTGRFSTPAKDSIDADADKRERLEGWPQVNVQAIPRAGGKDRPECMTRIRECISSRSKDAVVVSIDYSGVELRLITNLSMEPKWIQEFFHCSGCGRMFDRGDGRTTPEAPPARCPNCGSDKIGDLHTLTGLAVYGQDATSKDDWKELRGKAKCVHPDTLVTTPNGPERIGKTWKFGKEDEFIPVGGVVWNGENHVPVRETYNGGDKELFHVVTTRGLLTCSAEHGFKMADGAVKSISQGLTDNDLLAPFVSAPCPTQVEWSDLTYKPFPGVPSVTIKTTAEFAYFAGLFLGDGWKGGRTSAGLAHGPIGTTDKLGIPYAEWQRILTDACRQAGFDNPQGKKKTIVLGSRHVLRFLNALSLVSSIDGAERAVRTLRIPDWVWRSGKAGLWPFLGGLFDTDGTVGLRDGSMSVTTKDPHFAGDIAVALDMVGVLPYIEPCWNKTYSKWYYKVRVRGSDAEKFRLWLRHPGKIARLRPIKEGVTIPHKIKKIIPAGVGPCVDFHLDSDDHIYWTNGVLTHNSLNFAMSYGGGGSAAQRAVGVDKQEGGRIKRQFDGEYRGLKRWWEEQHAFAKAHGWVKTAFGRKYPVPDIFSTDGFFRSKAERNSVNGPIQGTSADITKLAMALVYKECKKRGWLDRVRMTVTMHDELVFEIDKEILDEAIQVVVPLMNRNQIIVNQNWAVPLTSDVEIGYDWSVPWNVNEMVYGEVRFIGNKKMKDAKKLPPGVTWESLPSWPDELRPWFAAAKGGPGTAAPPPPPSSPPPSTGGPAPTPPAPAAPAETPSAETAAEIPASAPPAEKAMETPRPATPRNPDVPDVVPGGDYEFRLGRTLSLDTLFRLADVIHRSMNGGTRTLRILTPDGKRLEGWNDADAPIRVNHLQFYFLAHEHGLT